MLGLTGEGSSLRESPLGWVSWLEGASLGQHPSQAFQTLQVLTHRGGSRAISCSLNQCHVGRLFLSLSVPCPRLLREGALKLREGPEDPAALEFGRLLWFPRLQSPLAE